MPATVITGSQTTYQITGKKEIVFERLYDASPAKVFAAFCDPALVPSWWGSRDAAIDVQAWDVKTGGSWRIVETDGRGRTSIFHGTYGDVQAPDRIEATLLYGDGLMSKTFAIDEVYEFVPQGKKTLLRLTSRYPMGLALKGMLRVGMDAPGENTEGSRHQWRLDRLATLVSGGRA